MMGGTGNLILNNVFKYSHGADAIQLWGKNHIIRGNDFSHIEFWGESTNHADIIQSFGDSGGESYGHLFERNYVHDCAEVQVGQLTMDAGATGSGGPSTAVINSGTFTAVGTTTASDSDQTWTTNQFAGTILLIDSGTAEGKVYLIASNTDTQLTVTDVEGNAVNMTTDGVAIGDSYRRNARLGWWTFRNNIFANIGTDVTGGYFVGYAPYMKWHNNTYYNINTSSGSAVHVPSEDET